MYQPKCLFASVVWEKWCVWAEGASVRQVFGLFKWKTPATPPAYPSPRQRVDWSRKLCVCFYATSHKVRAAERAQARISKGAGRLPSSQRDNTGRRISHRPSHPWLYSATAGGQGAFTSCFRSCLTGRESRQLCRLSLCIWVCVHACVCGGRSRGVP